MEKKTTTYLGLSNKQADYAKTHLKEMYEASQSAHDEHQQSGIDRQIQEKMISDHVWVDKGPGSAWEYNCHVAHHAVEYSSQPAQSKRFDK